MNKEINILPEVLKWQKEKGSGKNKQPSRSLSKKLIKSFMSQHSNFYRKWYTCSDPYSDFHFFHHFLTYFYGHLRYLREIQAQTMTEQDSKK